MFLVQFHFYDLVGILKGIENDDNLDVDTKWRQSRWLI